MKKIVLVLAAFFAFASLASASASVDADIKNFFENAAVRLEKISKYQDDRSKVEGIRKVSADILDLDWMGNFILGKTRRAAGKDEVAAFVKLYSNYLIENYLKILLSINTENYKIISIEKQREGIYMVGATIKYDNVDTKNTFRIVKNGDKYLITDIITEGISFVSSQRSDVNSRIDSVGFERFMREIKEKLKS
jgi:ABC-type transporter MlaC component